MIIYDPDRQLYRQFGISATAVGLQPGERRLSVFTSVDPRQSDAAPQTAGPQPVISACHSPYTDNEKECLLRRDMWGRGGDGSSEMPDSPSDSDSDLSIKWDTAKSRKRRRSKKRSPREEEKMTLRSGRERRATVLPLSPLSGRVFMDFRATEREMEREECTDKDKDTELDDLLNYEINLSCLNLDEEIVDCLSAKSRGSSHDDFGGSSWRDVSERLSPSDRQAHDHYFAMGYDGSLAGFSPTSCHSQMRDTVPSATGDGDSLEGSMRIVNFRPFYVPSTMKKPAKRINFIAAAAHTPMEKESLASVDSLGQANFDNVPDFELSSDKSIKKIGGPSQRKHLLAPAPSTIKKRQTRTMPTEILKPWGSTGARRRNSASTTMACTRHDPSSSAEKIYDENTDVERFQLNPETQSVGRESSKSIEKGGIFNPADIEPNPITTIVLTPQQAGLITALSSKTIHGDWSSTHSSIPTDLAEGPKSQFKSACSTDEHTLLRYHDKSSVSVSDFVVKAEAGTTERMTSTVKDTTVLLHDALLHSRSVMLENSIGSPLTVSESSRDPSQHPTNDPLAPTLRAADSVKANKKFGKKHRVEAHHNQLRAKERQRTLVKELESCIEGTLNESSPSSTIDSVPSPTTFPAPSPSITVATISGPLQYIALSIPPRTSKGDDQSHKRFVNTFTAVSPKFDRIMSEEEELVDSKIEAEINNFIVPDELSPVTLRQFGIEMDIKEVNGIRQNALLSLPALLDEIGRGSKEFLGQGELDVDEDDESFQDLFDTDLGLWGASVNPYIVEESLIETETDVALIEEDEADPSDSIERLISAGDATSRALLAGGLRKVSHSNPSTVCDGAETGDILYWVEASDSRNVVSSGVTDSEGSCNPNSVTVGLSFSSAALLGSTTSEPAVVPVVTLTSQEAEDLILHKEARLAWAALEMGTLSVSRDFASILLLKLADNSDAVVEPLETLVLLVDKLDADVNATNGNMMTPMHSLFSCPALGRFVLSRGGDVLLKDDNGDSVLALCAEYGYNWLLPAFISMHSREAKLLEDRDRAHEYAVVMLTLWGYGTRVSELIEDGLVCFSPDEALQLMEVCTNNFENMKEPVETFELLEALILGS